LESRYVTSPANEAVIVTDVWVVTLGAVYVTEAWPEELVVELAAERLPEVTLQVTVLPDNRAPLEASVAVKFVDPLPLRVKLEGETKRVVEGSTATVTVPAELPLLNW
jgi:hypothetical protein